MVLFSPDVYNTKPPPTNSMTIPAYILGIVLSTLYGAGFHLFFAGSARRLMLYLLTGWTGFAVGHWAGDLVGFHLYDVGALNFSAATLGAFIALFFSRWLADVDLDARDAEI